MSRHPERHLARPVAIRLRVAGIGMAAIGAGLALALALTGCTGAVPEIRASPAPSDSATATAEAAAPPATPSPTVAATPVLVPDGTAEDNLPVFTAVVAAVWATPQQVEGRAYVDALVAAGFDKAAMQLTPDQSTVGNAAESIQFSVRWGDQCLVGQVGPATGAPVAVVVPMIGAGTCLVGATRPIDW